MNFACSGRWRRQVGEHAHLTQQPNGKHAKEDEDEILLVLTGQWWSAPITHLHGNTPDVLNSSPSMRHVCKHKPQGIAVHLHSWTRMIPHTVTCLILCAPAAVVAVLRAQRAHDAAGVAHAHVEARGARRRDFGIRRRRHVVRRFARRPASIAISTRRGLLRAQSPAASAWARRLMKEKASSREREWLLAAAHQAAACNACQQQPGQGAAQPAVLDLRSSLERLRRAESGGAGTQPPPVALGKDFASLEPGEVER